MVPSTSSWPRVAWLPKVCERNSIKISLSKESRIGPTIKPRFDLRRHVGTREEGTDVDTRVLRITHLLVEP